MIVFTPQLMSPVHKVTPERRHARPRYNSGFISPGGCALLAGVPPRLEFVSSTSREALTRRRAAYFWDRWTNQQPLIVDRCWQPTRKRSMFPRRKVASSPGDKVICCFYVATV